MALGRPGKIFSGKVTSNTGPGVALPIQACHSITVKSHIDNTGVIFIGDSAVDANAFSLMNGEAQTLPVTDASTIFHAASLDGQTLIYIGVT